MIFLLIITDAFQLRQFLLPVTKRRDLEKGESEKQKDKKSKRNKINNEEKTCIIPKEKEEFFTNPMVKKEVSSFTKLMVKKEEAKEAFTNPVVKNSIIEFTLYLREKSKKDFIKTAKSVIIGRLEPEEAKYKDFDFFKIDAKECSRLHAFIYKTKVGYFLSDNNTQNGTYLQVLFIVLKNNYFYF